MPRKEIDPKEKKKQIPFMTETKKVDLLGKNTCQELAVFAVDKAYKKALRDLDNVSIDLAYNEAMNSHNPQKVADKKE